MTIQYEVPDSYSSSTGTLRLIWQKDFSPVSVFEIPLNQNNRKYEIDLACGVIDHAGDYILRFSETARSPILVESEPFTAVWPTTRIVIPRSHPTLTREMTLRVTVEGAKCDSKHDEVGDKYWIEVVYYGLNETITNGKPEPKQYIFKQDLEEISILQDVPMVLSCDLLDQAGIYRARLQSLYDEEYPIGVSPVMEVQWSDQYTLTAEKQYILDNCQRYFTLHYTQPPCVGQDDKIRLYKLERSPDASPASPMEQVYITERRAKSGRSHVTFSCELFDARVSTYCFRYVSLARNFAVHDQTTLCLQTSDTVGECLKTAGLESTKFLNPCR